MWTELGHAQLEAGAINDAIGSYLRSGDSSRYMDVIARSQEANAHGDLVKYLLMVRKKVKESKVRPMSSPKAGAPCWNATTWKFVTYTSLRVFTC